MLIVLLSIMFIPKESLADVGSFESYDSGSDWGSSDWESSDWSSSSSWDDDWGSSSSVNYSDESSLDGFTIGIIIVVIIIVAIAGRNKRWKYAYKTITSSTEHGICRTSNK